VQSFATADIVPLSLIHIENQLKGKNTCIVNTVHDSIVLDVHPDETEYALQVIDNTNDNLKSLIDVRWGIDFNVPLLLEAKIGPNWLDTKDVL
jgi:DNA polymerase I-like protein with 3'-5' exonuclease and polymerase domains